MKLGMQKINNALEGMNMDAIDWLDENTLCKLKKVIKSETKSAKKKQEEQKYDDGDSDDFSC